MEPARPGIVVETNHLRAELPAQFGKAVPVPIPEPVELQDEYQELA